MTPQTAEIIGFKALAFLVGTTEALDRFLDLTGLDAATLRARAEEQQMLASIIDFLLHDEELVVRFCGEESMPARDVHMARHVLSGS
ncbi:MAG TPA: DUF3572 domain-containing protein [Rhizomicrobium sp.]